MMTLTETTETASNMHPGYRFFDIADDQTRTVQLERWTPKGSQMWTYRLTSVLRTGTGVVWVSLARIKADGTDYQRGGFSSVQLERLAELHADAAAELESALAELAL
jgi:hypothetical protein